MEKDLLPQVEKMRMGVDYTFPVRLREFHVNLRPLSNAELMEAQAAAALTLRQMQEHRRTRITEDNELAKEYLERASSPFGTYAPVLSKPMLEQMTTEEVMFFYKEWLAVCDRVNPLLEKMPTEKLQELVDAVKKNPTADLHYQLTELSFGQLASLAFYLLTSDGSPQDK